MSHDVEGLTFRRDLKDLAATNNVARERPERNLLYEMLLFHIDEETAREIPNTKMKMTSESCMGTRANNVGSYDMLTDQMHNYLCDMRELPY